MSYWTRWQSDEGDPYVRFAEPGDTVEGVIAKLTSTDFGGTRDAPIPVVHLENGKIINAQQTVLIRRLAELAPEVGDHIVITFTGEAQRSAPGRNPAKLFDVVVTPKLLMGGQATEPPAREAPPPRPSPPVGEGPPF